MKAGIVGAGIVGRLLAYLLAQNDWDITLFDQDTPAGNASCSKVAAGLLTPIAELEKSDPVICQMGEEALNIHWPKIINSLKSSVFFQKKGSLVLAHPRDEAELVRFVNLINMKMKQPILVSSATEISQLEPEISKFETGYYFANEGQLDNQELLNELQKTLQGRIKWHDNTFVTQLAPRKIIWEQGEENFDYVFDCRGLGAKNYFNKLRGVRGELIWLHANEVNIQRPVRLLHPRYSLYIVPRPQQIYILGASEIESEDKSSISVRTTMELLSAAFYVHAGFGEARVIHTAVNCRPTLADHLPQIKFSKGLIAINGLYRHGFLLAPTLVNEVINYLHHGMGALQYPQIWCEEKTNLGEKQCQ